MPFLSRVLPIDRLLFSGETLCLGQFAAPVDHPLFRHHGAADSHYVAFPRTSVWIRHDGRPPFLADPTVATCYNPGDVYFRQAADPRGDRADWIALSPPLAREIVDACGRPSSGAGFAATRLACDAAMYARQRQLFDAARGGGTPLAIEESALRLVERLVTNGRPLSPLAGKRDIAEHARAIIARRFRARLSLSALARQVGASPFHLCRTFARRTGLRMGQYQEQLRVRAALEPLLDDRQPLIDIALHLGFSSHSHFSAAFRRTFGMTPSACRRGRLRPSLEAHVRR